jgi:hypothetical protein
MNAGRGSRTPSEVDPQGRGASEQEGAPDAERTRAARTQSDRAELEKRLLLLAEDVRASAAEAAQRRRQATQLEARVHIEGVKPQETRVPSDVGAPKVVLAPGLDPRNDQTLVGQRRGAALEFGDPGKSRQVKQNRRRLLLLAVIGLCGLGAAALQHLMRHPAALTPIARLSVVPLPSVQTQPPKDEPAEADASMAPAAEAPQAKARASVPRGGSHPQRRAPGARTKKALSRRHGGDAPVGAGPVY